MIIAVDFDGTLAKTEYPTIIEPIQKVIDFIKHQKSIGNVIILNTCRHDERLNNAVEWCGNQGIEFDYVNENAKELIDLYGDCRKIAADIYIDDKNMLIKDLAE